MVRSGGDNGQILWTGADCWKSERSCQSFLLKNQRELTSLMAHLAEVFQDFFCK